MNAPPEQLLEKLQRLRLPGFVKHLHHLYQSDPEGAARFAKSLEKMAEDELAARAERSIQVRVRDAHFIRVQTVDAFDFDYNPSTRKLRKRYLQLFHTDIITQGIGAIFVGNSGLGKTHLARALGYATCQRAQRVLFLSCSCLLNRLVTAEVTKDLEREIKKLLTPALLIIDELGYLALSHQEANLFFQVISRRHDHGRPCVVTTNKPFGQWNQVFHGDATAHAIVDRLTEKAEIFYLEGKSYRQTHRKGLAPDTNNNNNKKKERQE